MSPFASRECCATGVWPHGKNGTTRHTAKRLLAEVDFHRDVRFNVPGRCGSAHNNTQSHLMVARVRHLRRSCQIQTSNTYRLCPMPFPAITTHLEAISWCITSSKLTSATVPNLNPQRPHPSSDRAVIHCRAEVRPARSTQHDGPGGSYK